MQNHGSLIIVPRMRETCTECGCVCTKCLDNNLDLHHEIEELKSKLKCSENHKLEMEEEFSQSREFNEQEISKYQEELIRIRDRYDRLFESHKMMQKLNHNLEDKLLKIVNKFEVEKNALQNEVASLSAKIVDSKMTICDLEEECERYRDDCNMAVQLLQCKPSSFVSHKLDTLPIDLQERVKSRLTGQQLLDLENSRSKSNEVETSKMIRVPMATFPPTAMVYSVNKIPPTQGSMNGDGTNVPTNIIAKVLSQPETNRKPRKIYLCIKCRHDVSVTDCQIQTTVTYPNDANGYYPGLHHYRSPALHTLPRSSASRSASSSLGFLSQPGVHRPRLNSTETEI